LYKRQIGPSVATVRRGIVPSCTMFQQHGAGCLLIFFFFFAIKPAKKFLNLRNQTVYHQVHKSPSLDSVLSYAYFNPVPTLYTNLPKGLFPPGFTTKIMCAFIFCLPSRPALWPTQPPIQWVPGALSLGVKRQGREADHSPPSSAEVKECVDLYLHSPIRLHGLVLSLKKHRDNFIFTCT
jgi:hypothetical protein